MKKGRDLVKSIWKSFFGTHLNIKTTLRQMNPSERYCYNPTLHWNSLVEEYFFKAYGADHFSRISKSLTQPSCYSCIRVNTLKTTSDAVIEKLSKILEETGWPNELEKTHMSNNDEAKFIFSGKHRSTLNDSNIGQDTDISANTAFEVFDNLDLSKANGQASPISKCQLPGLDYVLFVRGSGPHATPYEIADDKPLKEVIVSRKCAESVLRGAQVFVPGVLACSAHVELGDVVAVSVAVEQSISEGKWGTGITRGTVMQGLQTAESCFTSPLLPLPGKSIYTKFIKIVIAPNPALKEISGLISYPLYLERSGLYIGQGTTTLSRAGIFRAAHGIAVNMKDRVYRLPSINDVLEGEIFLQNFPSIITAHALDPQEGERILDMCAAPGGKTTAIAILMKDKGEVIAVDRSHNKVLDIQKLAAEMGLRCITTYKLDATKSVCPEGESIDRTPLSSKEDTCLNIQKLEPRSLKIDTSVKIATNELDMQTNHSEKFIHEQAKNGVYTSKAEQRKNDRRMKNGPGRKRCSGERVEKSRGFAPDSFDRILLDAPCSALGLRPRLFSGEETIESLRKHATYQRRMLDQAVQLVRPGGVIVYSTCTINPGENEALVRYALDTYRFLSLASQHPRIGGPGLVGGCTLPDGYAEEWLRPGEEDYVQRFDPSSSLDTIGFFIAKFSVGPKYAV